MTDTRDKLAAWLGDHCWLSSDEQKVNGEWTSGLNCECGEFVPDREVNLHLADALLASDVLRDMLAEAEARGRAEVTAAVEVVLERWGLLDSARAVDDLRNALADRGALNRVRAEAWDEGHQAAYLFERGETYPEPRNPYRIERDGGA